MKNHLLLLKLCFDEIHLVLLQNEGEVDQFDLYFSKHPDEFDELKLLFNTKITIELSIHHARSRMLNYFYVSTHPVEWVFPFLNKKSKMTIAEVVKRIDPDIIWAENLTAVALCFYFLRNKRKNTYYAHHDWGYKLRWLRHPHRNNEISYFLRSYFLKFIEISVVRKVGAVVSSSWSEYQDCLRLGVKKAMYVPLFVSNPLKQLTPDVSAQNFKLFHLGGMKTTANRIGLGNFLNYCWPTLKKRIPNIELVLVGSISGANESLRSLLNDPSIQIMGYIENVDSVLLPYSIHIIPWNKNTGVRTKVPIAMRNKQVIVGMKESLECFVELAHSENAMLVNSFDELTTSIVKLRDNFSVLHQMGDRSFDTYNRSFVFGACKEPFINFMK